MVSHQFLSSIQLCYCWFGAIYTPVSFYHCTLFIWYQANIAVNICFFCKFSFSFFRFLFKNFNKRLLNVLSNGCSCMLSFLEAHKRKQNASIIHLPNNGLSEVTGIVADTMFKNTVRLRRIVTPGMKSNSFLLHLVLLFS